MTIYDDINYCSNHDSTDNKTCTCQKIISYRNVLEKTLYNTNTKQRFIVRCKMHKGKNVAYKCSMTIPIVIIERKFSLKVIT